MSTLTVTRVWRHRIVGGSVLLLLSIVAVTVGLLPSLSHGQTSAIPKGDVVVEHAFSPIKIAQAGVFNLNFIIPTEFTNFVPFALDGVWGAVEPCGAVNHDQGRLSAVD